SQVTEPRCLNLCVAQSLGFAEAARRCNPPERLAIVVPVREHRPLIAVTTGNRPDRGGMPRLAVNRSYLSALQAAGADVVLLPPAPSGQPPRSEERRVGKERRQRGSPEG